MTMMQERAIEIIKRLSDDKISYVVNILEGIDGLFTKENEAEITKSQKAYQNLQRFRKSSPVELDYKEELAGALVEKYESLN